MLKKQTVWLLTMISLMVVLSVYYMMSDQNDLAYTDQSDTDLEQMVHQQNADETEVTDVKQVEGEQLFTTIRMQLEDERSLKKDRLKDTVASSSANATEVNDALNEIDSIEKLESSELILQETILSTDKAYEDVLVRTKDEKVHVHVITETLSKEAANHIMQMVMDEMGEVRVDVNFQPVES